LTCFASKRSPSVSRVSPAAKSKNVGEDYHGCLRINVHRSSALYRKIEGWAQAIMTPPVQDGSQASNQLLQLPEKDLNLH
jgi:hypothetical protein